MKRAIYLLLLSILGLSTALPPTFNGFHVRRINPVPAKDRSPNSRIIGGDEVEPNSVPYQAALLINGASLCGGSLISTKTVLTAAHCTLEASFVQVILGAHNISRSETTQVRVSSSSIINHEDYNNLLENDLALVFLPTPVTLSNVITTVPLAPSTAPSYASNSAYLTGWGMTSDDSSTSPVLRGVALTILTNTECARSFPFIGPSHVCTSGVGVVGACNSDSGGPLVVDGVQVGIVSFGPASCLTDSPTGFARVSYYRDWIEKNGEV